MQPRIVGLAIAAATLVADQASKAWMLKALAAKPMLLLPVLDLQLAWNTGISYSLLRADGPFGRTLLVAVALAAAVALAVWLARARRTITGAALGLLIGGAVGNAADRAFHGAVVDFVHLHWGGFAPFGVFNVADVAITAGVLLLLAEALFMKDQAATEPATPGGSAPQVDSANKLP